MTIIYRMETKMVLKSVLEYILSGIMWKYHIVNMTQNRNVYIILYI